MSEEIPPHIVKKVLENLARIIREQQEQLSQQAEDLEKSRYCRLTEILLGEYLNVEVSKALEKRKNRDGYHGLIYCDLDGFKAVNDAHGHDEGDRILRNFVKWVKPHIRNSDIPVRFHGDEFGIFFPHTTPEKIEQVAQKIKDFATMKGVHGVTVSIGGVYVSDEQYQLDQLIKAADLTMYRVKHSGKDGYIVEEIPRVA